MSNLERLDEIFVHIRLLPLFALPIGEFFDLDALAEECASDGVYKFLFTSAPLNLKTGVASPPIRPRDQVAPGGPRSGLVPGRPLVTARA